MVGGKFGKLASDERIERTVKSLKEKGVEVYVVGNREEVKKKVLQLIPKGSEVMTMTSKTLQDTGIDSELNSERFNSIRNKLANLRYNKEMKKLVAGSDFVLGSIHAITELGEIIIASASGSQLSSYAYEAEKVIFVIGTQKIVKNIKEGFRRIYEYCLPLEDKRARIAYGVGSAINKILIINKEFQPRIVVIFVKEKLGF